MKTNLLPHACLGLVLLLFTPCAGAHAQQAATGSNWVVGSGPILVQINSGGIHINQLNPQELTHFATVSKHVTLGAGKPWKVSFEVRFGELRSAGTAVGIFDGDQTLGWVGADVWYKRMGCFVGKGNEVAQPTANTDWHKFEFISDGAKITVSDNGIVVGSSPQSGTPSLIKIGDIFDAIPPPLPPATTPPPGQQTEIWVRNVVSHSQPSETPAAPLVSRSPLPVVANDESLKQFLTPAPQPMRDDSTASLDETRQWICNTLNKSAGTFWRDGTDQVRYSNAFFDENELVFSDQDNILGLIVYENYRVPLDKMDESRVAVSKQDASSGLDQASYIVKIAASGDALFVSKSYRIYTDAQPNEPAKQEYEGTLTFQFSSSDLAERFAKAIRHGIRLGKANPHKESF